LQESSRKPGKIQSEKNVLVYGCGSTSSGGTDPDAVRINELANKIANEFKKMEIDKNVGDPKNPSKKKGKKKAGGEISEKAA
jgi:hypothetical protein